ncbi:MAG: hypothetical protein Fur005_11020 [Roseiflexaceae bacterium]
MKPWSWEVAGSGQGPDWVFLLEIAPMSLDRQATITQLPPPSGYELCGLDGRRFIWMDQQNAENYRRNLGGATQNIWIYDAIQLEAQRLTCEAGYGGRGGELHTTATTWVLDLIDRGLIRLNFWSVMAGGNGYEYHAFAQGEGEEALRAYLISPLEKGSA